MKRMKRSIGRVAGVGALSASLVLGAGYLGAADHLDAPAVRDGDGRTDINDLYAFQSTENRDNTVLIMTVNPGAGVISGTTFDHKASYTFNVDANSADGQVAADTAIVVDFKGLSPNGQTYEVSISGQKVAKGKVGETLSLRDGGKVTAGVFDDPFFFDLDGFNAGDFSFSGDDFFAGLNVSAIVVEIPSIQLSTNDNIAVWATTSSKTGAQIDRIGRPAINTVLIPSDRKDEFNQADPANDVADFTDDVVATITTVLGNGDNAAGLAEFLLPDVLTVDTSVDAAFPNGRRLADDVIDVELGLLSGGAVTTDMVDANDVPFRTSFPYLAPAN